jgi:serine/threonine-protein kinase
MSEGEGAANTRVGKLLGGKYRLVRLLGAGGMGEVYEAQHELIGRRFAIKFLHPQLASNTEVVARFQREAQAAGGLENENIAAVVDAGTADDGAPYLVMEYLDGEDLAHLLVRGGALPLSRAVFIMIQACRGLAAAHRRGIVHRDLKPENLYICRRNDSSDLVKVLDFGIAKLHTGRASTSLTQTGTTMGTPYYMSLEQARGARDVDHRTDIYALGVILYEMLSGAKPHPGESYNAILYHVLTQEPAPLDSMRPDLPSGMSAIVRKAMAREPGDRYASVAEFMEALIPFSGRSVTPLRSQAGLPVVMGATMQSPVSLRAMAVPAPLKAETPEIPDDVPAGSRSRVVVWATSAAVAVLLVVLGLWFGLHREPKQQAAAPAPPALPVPAPVPAPTPAPTPAPPLVPVAAPAPPFGGFGTDSPPHLPPRASHAPVAAPAPAPVSPPPSAKIESPPGRSPRQRSQKRTTATVFPTADIKPPSVVPPAAHPAENSDNGLNSRRKPARSIDRSNPFAD